MSNIDLSDSKIVDTWKALGEKGAVENWMLLNFVDKNKLQVLSKGKGGLSELKQQLKDDEVMFAILRIGAEDRKEALTSVRQKFMMVTWIGPQVGIMKKAKVGPQREELINILPGLQFFLGASELEEVDMQHLAAKLLAAGGESTFLHTAAFAHGKRHFGTKKTLWPTLFLLTTGNLGSLFLFTCYIGAHKPTHYIFGEGQEVALTDLSNFKSYI